MWKFLLPFAAFIALAVLFAFGLNPSRDIHALPSPLIGKAAPLFKLTDVTDPSRIISNAELKGQVYVLNVWGTWCVACRQEHEALLAISQQELPAKLAATPQGGIADVTYTLPQTVALLDKK